MLVLLPLTTLSLQVEVALVLEQQPALVVVALEVIVI
jgi:hypothetical protein